MGKTENVKILLCCHKPDKWLSDDVYIPIHCGKALSNVDLDIQGDDIGDNISVKNPNYCELTAMYWAWKNLKDVDYIGLCHYRRYFAFNYKGIRESIYTNSWDDIVTGTNLNAIFLSDYDVILAKPYTVPFDMYTWYAMCHHSDDIKLVKEIICSRYPNYINAFEEIMCGNSLTPYNMFIMKKQIFDEYCNWLFDILGDIEKKLKIRDYNTYQKRAIAFIAERLLPVYFYSTDYKKKNVSIYCLYGKENESIIKWGMRKVIDEASYFFFKQRHLGGFYEK